jgi:hypothetical protein
VHSSSFQDVNYGFLNVFEIQKDGDKCENDYVEVKDGGSEVDYICGKQDYPATLTNATAAKSNKLVYKFKSDNNKTSVFKGFEAIVKSVELKGKFQTCNATVACI